MRPPLQGTQLPPASRKTAGHKPVAKRRVRDSNPWNGGGPPFCGFQDVVATSFPPATRRGGSDSGARLGDRRRPQEARYPSWLGPHPASRPAPRRARWNNELPGVLGAGDYPLVARRRRAHVIGPTTPSRVRSEYLAWKALTFALVWLPKPPSTPVGMPATVRRH